MATKVAINQLGKQWLRSANFSEKQFNYSEATEKNSTSLLTPNNLPEIFHAFEQAGLHTQKFALTEALSRSSQFKDFQDPQMQFNQAKSIHELPNFDHLLEHIGFKSPMANQKEITKIVKFITNKNIKRFEDMSSQKGNKKPTQEYIKKIIISNKEISGTIIREIKPEIIQSLKRIFTEKKPIFNPFTTQKIQDAEMNLWLKKHDTILQLRNGTIKAENLSPSEQADKDIMITAVQRRGIDLEYASNELKADYDVVLAAVQNDGLAIYEASPQMRGNRDIALAAVTREGLALSCVSEALKNDHEVVLAAVSHSGYTLQYAHPDLRANREIVFAAVRNQPNHAFQYASPDLQEDPEIKALLNNA